MLLVCVRLSWYCGCVRLLLWCLLWWCLVNFLVCMWWMICWIWSLVWFWWWIRILMRCCCLRILKWCCWLCWLLSLWWCWLCWRCISWWMRRLRLLMRIRICWSIFICGCVWVWCWFVRSCFIWCWWFLRIVLFMFWFEIIWVGWMLWLLLWIRRCGFWVWWICVILSLLVCLVVISLVLRIWLCWWRLCMSSFCCVNLLLVKRLVLGLVGVRWFFIVLMVWFVVVIGILVCRRWVLLMRWVSVWWCRCRCMVVSWLWCFWMLLVRWYGLLMLSVCVSGWVVFFCWFWFMNLSWIDVGFFVCWMMKNVVLVVFFVYCFW